MKKLVISLLVALIIPLSAGAATTTVPWLRFNVGGLQPVVGILQTLFGGVATTTDAVVEIQGGYLEVTDPTATSTLPRLSSTGGSFDWLCLTGDDCIVQWPTGGSGSQTPWEQAIDGGGFALTNAGAITGTVLSATSTTATSTITNALQLGSTAGDNKLKILGTRDYSNSSSVGGVVNISNGTNLGSPLVVYSNAGTGGGRGISLRCDNGALDTQCFHVETDSTIESSFNILGAPLAKGIVKIGSNGVGDADASALSIDGTLSSYVGQGIFLNCNTTTNRCLNFRVGNTEKLVLSQTGVNIATTTTISAGNLGVGTTNPQSKLEVDGSGFFTDVTTPSAGVGLELNYTPGSSASFITSHDFDAGENRALTITGSQLTLVQDDGSTVGPLYMNNGRLGFATSTPGTTFSLGNTGNDTINISTTATSTFGSGINLRSGCFAVNGTCVGGGGGGGVDGYDFTYNTDIGYGRTGSATTTPIQFTEGIHASSTSHLQYATSTQLTVLDFLTIPQSSTFEPTYTGQIGLDLGGQNILEIGDLVSGNDRVVSTKDNHESCLGCVPVSDSSEIFWSSISSQVYALLSATSPITFNGSGDFGFDNTASGVLNNGANPTVNTDGHIAHDTTNDQLLFGAEPNVLMATSTMHFTLEALAAADDNRTLGSFGDAVTIVGIRCIYDSSFSTTTLPTIALADLGGNAMTHTAPFCKSDSATTTPVTTNNTLVAGEGFKFSVTNSPAPETVTYTISVDYKKTRQ